MDEYRSVHQHIDEQFDEHLERIRALIRQPSVSPGNEFDSPDVRACARMVRDSLEELGVERLELAEFSAGYPVVFGIMRSRNPDAKTMLLYSFYDVMPADEPEWKVNPFAAEIVDAEEVDLPSFFGECLVARGADHPKGPLMAFINALRSMKDVAGDIPVNVMFVVEGEEERGSPSLGGFRDTHLDQLSQADCLFFPKTSQSLDEEGAHEFELGYKGLLPVELRVRGGAWGGSTRDLFSADVAWVDAPASRLVKALSTLQGPDGRVSIEGFYDEVRPPTAEETQLLRGLVEHFDEEAKREELGITRFRGGQSGRDLLEGYVMDPQLNINGLVAGYTGPQMQTMLPKEAVAKMDIRMVPDMKAGDVLLKLRHHLDRHGFPEVEIRTWGGYPWSRTSVSAEVARAAMRATETHGLENAPRPTHVACAPFSLFTEPPLGLPAIAAGLGRSGNVHVANEYFTLDGIRLLEKWVVTFLYEYARL